MRKKVVKLNKQDKKYEKAINLLIPKAKKHADGLEPKANYKSKDKWAYAWNIAFHGEMNRLAEDAGLRKSLN